LIVGAEAEPPEKNKPFDVIGFVGGDFEELKATCLYQAGLTSLFLQLGI